MIVIDGDSVALAVRASVYPHQTWWGQLTDKTIVLATPQATMLDCLARIHIVLDAKPAFYVLMVGQWAHNHEPLDVFARSLNEAIEKVAKAGIRVILITPIYSPKIFDGFDITPFVDAIRAAADIFKDSGVHLIDLHKIIKEHDILEDAGLHLGVAGNRLLFQHINDLLPPVISQ